MCKLTLNAVVTLALADERFRQELLNGEHERAFQALSLDDEERALLQNIRANSLETFVAQIHGILQHEETGAMPVVALAGGQQQYAPYVAVGAD
ncbi:MAG: hypothetical protein GXO56_04660 [Chloroflexi bacterium]|nr:hypothetical protein [Chloroflexota bacterium]